MAWPLMPPELQPTLRRTVFRSAVRWLMGQPPAPDQAHRVGPEREPRLAAAVAVGLRGAQPPEWQLSVLPVASRGAGPWLRSHEQERAQAPSQPVPQAPAKASADVARLSQLSSLAATPISPVARENVVTAGAPAGRWRLRRQRPSRCARLGHRRSGRANFGYDPSPRSALTNAATLFKAGGSLLGPGLA